MLHKFQGQNVEIANNLKIALPNLLKVLDWQCKNKIIVIFICFKEETHETCNHMKFQILQSWSKHKASS
jgi:hypothetical protein